MVALGAEGLLVVIFPYGPNASILVHLKPKTLKP